MKKSLVLLTAGLMGLNTASAAQIFAAWDLNEGSGAATQYQLAPGMTWNQVTNPTEAFAPSASADIGSTAGINWGGAGTAPGSTASLTFDGTNADNSLNTNVSGAGLDGTGAKTFLAWINVTSLGDRSILSYSPSGGNGPGSGLRMRLETDGNLRAEVSAGAFVSKNQNLVNNGWTLVAAIFDTDVNTSSLYIGGIGRLTDLTRSGGSTEIDTGNLGVTSGDSPNIVIGGMHGAGAFVGGIDMVGVYEGALTESELDNIYANGIAIPEPGTLTLAALSLITLAIFRRRVF